MNELQRLANRIENHLFAIGDLVGDDYKITLCCRHKSNRDAHILMTIDDIVVVIDAIRHTAKVGNEIERGATKC